MSASNWEVMVNRVILLNTKWLYWTQLFGTEDSVTLLNHLAPSCFALIQESVLLDVIASTARLLDRGTTLGKGNLVIESLLADVPSGAEKDRLTASLQGIKTDGQTLIQIRHKVIAHEDQAVATGMAAITPSDSTLIEGLISRINALMREMEVVAGKPLHVFGPITVRGSGKTVLWLLGQSHSSLVEAMSFRPPNTAPDVPDATHVAMIPVRSPA